MCLSVKGNNVASFSTIDGARLFKTERASCGVKISIIKVTTLKENVG